MARLTIERLTRSFGAFRALDDVSLDVDDGELVAVLGASGCGKTTLLRQIAGFDRAEAGRILIGDEVVSSTDRHVPPERRRVGIVFQSYALWPHLTVGENVGYGLAVARVRGPERARRIEAALALVDLAGFDARRPAMLSGGQRQRVALARCLVTEPSLVLLDEPLANLDVHLRAAMEQEFARFHARTRTTMIYITHDQSEAMALADRIAVMDRGRILQIASPSTLYREPADAVVARFIGDGTLVPVEVRRVDGNGTCDAQLFGCTVRLRCGPAQRTSAAWAAIHDGDVVPATASTDGFLVTVERAVYRGGSFRLDARAAPGDGGVVHLQIAEAQRIDPGASLRVCVLDGWVIASPP